MVINFTFILIYFLFAVDVTTADSYSDKIFYLFPSNVNPIDQTKVQSVYGVYMLCSLLIVTCKICFIRLIYSPTKDM